MSFVGLRIHSDYSLLDGASQIPQLIDRCLELDIKRDRVNGSSSDVDCDSTKKIQIEYLMLF